MQFLWKLSRYGNINYSYSVSAFLSMQYGETPKMAVQKPVCAHSP